MKIISKPSTTIEQIMKFINNKNNAHPLCKAIVPMVYSKALEKGINPTIAVAQSLKETGYFNFKGVLRPNFCNICGLKGAGGGGDYDPNAHKRFEYWEDGVEAFIDHLALYAGVDGYPKYSVETELYYKSKGTFYDVNKIKKNGTTLDPRHFSYLLGTAKTVEELSGKWCPSKSYGEDIISMVKDIEKIEVKTNEVEHILKDIEKKFLELKEVVKND